jgi:hypothetical protein
MVHSMVQWYNGRSAVLKEARTRRRNGRHGGGGRERRRVRRRRGRPCADARATMDCTTKGRREYSSSTPPVDSVRRELPCSAEQCVPVVMCHTTQKMHSVTRTNTPFWEYPLSTPEYTQ